MSNTQAEGKLSKEDVIGRNPYEIKEGIVFCIELTHSLFEFDPLLQHSQLEEILMALLETMASLVISLPNTGIGCYLFNVKGEKDGIKKLIELKDLNATDTKSINDILEDHRANRLTLEDRFPIADNKTNLFQVLSLIQDEFLYSKNKYTTKSYNNKKIFLFSDNDKPYNGNYQLQLSLKKLLGDFQDSFINIVPFFTDRVDGGKFDKTEYDNILFQAADDDDEDEGEKLDKPRITTMSADKIRSKINRVKEVKRVQYTCPLEIAPNLKISIKGFSLFTHEKLSSSLKVVNEGDKYLMVNGKNILLDELTGSEINTAKIIKAYKVGDDLIPLTAEQISKIKEFGEPEKPCLKIIGFRGLSHYLRHYNSANSTFITPDNNGQFSHSQRTLSCLYQAMHNTTRYAIVWGYARSNSSPSLYAMVPSSLIKGNFPEGFFLTRLPYRDDIRQLPPTLKTYPIPSPDLVKNYESILKRFYMKNGYVPQEYENPSIQWHYKIVRDEFCQVEVEPFALTKDNEINQKLLNEFDTTKKKIGNVRNVIMASMLENRELGQEPKFVQQKSIAELIKTLNSRLNKLSNEAINEEVKKPKLEPELQDKDVLKAYKLGTLSSYKVSQLRPYIKKRDIPCSGNNKKDLIEGLMEFLSTKNIT